MSPGETRSQLMLECNDFSVLFSGGGSSLCSSCSSSSTPPYCFPRFMHVQLAPASLRHSVASAVTSPAPETSSALNVPLRQCAAQSSPSHSGDPELHWWTPKYLEGTCLPFELHHCYYNAQTFWLFYYLLIALALQRWHMVFKAV